MKFLKINTKEEKTQTKYYVSYASNNGYGATEIISDEEVKGIADIVRWADLISDSVGERVVIIMWRKY